jgi:hypothetical protein
VLRAGVSEARSDFSDAIFDDSNVSPVPGVAGAVHDAPVSDKDLGHFGIPSSQLLNRIL